VIVHVDEPGRHGQVGGIHCSAAGRVLEVADRGYASASDPDIGGPAGGAAAVNHESICDDKVVALRLSERYCSCKK
jgi:hypothetical protein